MSLLLTIAPGSHVLVADRATYLAEQGHDYQLDRVAITGDTANRDYFGADGVYQNYQVNSALLTQAAAPAITLTASTGSFTETAADALFIVTMPSATGSYALAGNTANLLHAPFVTSSTGAYTLAGQAATFALGMPSDVGVYALAGQATFAITLPSDLGAYALNGQAANFAISMPSTKGAYLLSGRAAILIWSGAPQATPRRRMLMGVGQ